MSQENVDVVRHIYGAWRTEGSPVASGLLDPEIEWVNPPDGVEPGEIDEMLDAGERVVVLATLHGGETDVERRQGYIWTIHDGRAIRFQWFKTPDEAMRAAHLHC